jgi:hypothetical protein
MSAFLIVPNTSLLLFSKQLVLSEYQIDERMRISPEYGSSVLA